MSLSKVLNTTILAFILLFCFNAQTLDTLFHTLLLLNRKMTLLRNPMFSSIVFMNMCKGHMSLCMLLNGSHKSKNFLYKIVNSQLLMTISAGDIKSPNMKMSPAPPSTSISNDVHSLPFEANYKTKVNIHTPSSSNSSESELLQLAKVFNKFYFQGKNDKVRYILTILKIKSNR